MVTCICYPKRDPLILSSKFAFRRASVLVFLTSGLAHASGRLSPADRLALRAVIVADNEFYSPREELSRRGLPMTVAAQLTLPPFLGKSAPGDQINKTGLGSSAALATSLTAALLTQLGVAALPAPGQAWSDEALQVVHNTAQFAHCLAQGKVGSGFDVSAAVFGSQQYCRFSPSIIEGPLKSTDLDYHSLLGTVSRVWDSEHLAFRLPPGLRLLTGDVSVGSSTPTMVSKLLEWTRKSSEAAGIWDELDGHNQSVAALFAELEAASGATDYQAELARLGEQAAEAWTGPLGQQLAALRTRFLHARRLLKTMGEKSDVAVEPDEQSRLLDATMALPGVLIAGVPGAGGFDAIFAVTLGESEAVWGLWATWAEMSVMPLPLGEDSAGVAACPPEKQQQIRARAGLAPN